MKKITGLGVFMVLVMFLFIGRGDSAHYVRDKVDYYVKNCTEYDIVADGDGNATTVATPMSAIGFLWVSIIPDQAGDDNPYDEDFQPTDNFTFNVVNEYGVVVVTTTVDNVTEFNDMIVGGSNSTPIYIQKLTTDGDPKFWNAAAGDFRVKNRAVSIGGTNVGLTTDINGQKVPFGGGYPIGAYRAVGKPWMFIDGIIK